jgi:hypothetical protein
MIDLLQLKLDYVAYYGKSHGLAPGVINEVELALGVIFPDDLKFISTFYNGGVHIAAIMHHNLSPKYEPSVLGETLRLRKAIGLPKHYVMLSEMDESVIFLDCRADALARVIWCGNELVDEVCDDELPSECDIWNTYNEFFAEYLYIEINDRPR